MSAPSAEVERDLAHRLVAVGRVHLVGAAVAELRRRLGGLAERPVERRGELGRVRHDRTCMKPSSSSAVRIAPTRPSIMSDGATMSAPARACESASRASSSSVASLSTSLPAHHAAMAVVGVLAHADVGDHGEPGHVLLDFANRALHLALVVPRLAAAGVLALRDAEQDHRRNAGRVRSRAPRAPRCRPTSARLPASRRSGVRTSRPGQTKYGWIRSSGESRVSRIIRRSVSVRRSRRGRLIGNAIGILTPSRAELGTRD